MLDLGRRESGMVEGRIGSVGLGKSAWRSLYGVLTTRMDWISTNLLRITTLLALALGVALLLGITSSLLLSISSLLLLTVMAASTTAVVIAARHSKL